MQLKGLVRFFAIALILICLYQLSFTWIVRSHERTQEEKASAWVKANFLSPEKKYPGNKELQSAYADSLANIEKQRKQRLLDSTKDTKIGPFNLTTYQDAKDKELMMGLDLQGGMSVTMEVGLDGLIRSLANYPKDAAFNNALNNAVIRKANSGADLISLFGEEFKKASNGAKLAPYFSTRSDNKVKVDASDDAVLNYLRTQAADAFNNTVRILTTRIDRFGVTSPNINPNPAKGIINIELPGVNDPERVRRYLQSTANLQFFEVYNINDIAEALQSADKSVSDYLKGTSASDTAVTKPDTTQKKAQQPAANIDTTKTYTLSGTDTGKKTGTIKTTDSTKLRKNENPLFSLFAGIAQGQKDQNGGIHFPAHIGYVMKKDTGLLGTYLRMDMVSIKFPSNLVF
jgi:SecD/SecF fusion protein